MKLRFNVLNVHRKCDYQQNLDSGTSTWSILGHRAGLNNPFECPGGTEQVLEQPLRAPWEHRGSTGAVLWTTGAVLRAIGAVLWAIGAVLWATRALLRATGTELWATGAVLWAIGAVVQTIGAVLWAVGAVLWATGAVLRATGAVLWATGLFRVVNVVSLNVFNGFVGLEQDIAI